MRVNDKNAKLFEIIVPGAGQSQTVADACALLVRTSDHIKGERKIGGASGHWTDNCEIAFARQCGDPRRRMSKARHETQGRLMRINPAIMRGSAHRSTKVRTKRQRTKAARERRGRAARRAPGRETKVPGIIGCPVDVVVALPVAQRQRHIGLAENDGARILYARNDQRVFFWLEAPEIADLPSSSAALRY